MEHTTDLSVGIEADAVEMDTVTACSDEAGQQQPVEQEVIADFDDGLFDSMLNTIMGPSDGVFGQLNQEQTQQSQARELPVAVDDSSQALAVEDKDTAKTQTILHELNEPSVVDWCLRARLRFVSSLGFRCLMQAICHSARDPRAQQHSAGGTDELLHKHGLLNTLSTSGGNAPRAQAMFRECLEQRSTDFHVAAPTAKAPLQPLPPPHPAHTLLHQTYFQAQHRARSALHQHRFPSEPLPRAFLGDASAAADTCCASMQVTPQYTHKASSSSTLPHLHLPVSRRSDAAQLLLLRRLRFVQALCSAVGGMLRGEGGDDVAVLYADGNYVHFRRVRPAGAASAVLFATLASSTPGLRKALRQRNIAFRTPLDPELETEHIRVDADAVAELVRLNRDTGISVRHTSSLRRRAPTSVASGSTDGVQGGDAVGAQKASLVAEIGHTVNLSRNMAHKLNGQEDLGGGGVQPGGGQLSGSSSFAVASALVVVGARQCCQLVAALGEDALQGGAGALSDSARRWVWGASLGAGAQGTPIPGVVGANVSCGLHTIGNDIPSIVAATPFHLSVPARLRVVDRGALRVPVLREDGSTDSATFTTVYALDVTGPILPQVARGALQALAQLQALLTVSHQCFRVCVPRVIRSVEFVPVEGLKAISGAIPALSAWLQDLLNPPSPPSEDSPPLKDADTALSPCIPEDVLQMVSAVRAAVRQAVLGGLTLQRPAGEGRPSVNRKLLSAQYRSVVDSLSADIPKAAMQVGAASTRGGVLVAVTQSQAPRATAAQERAGDGGKNTHSVFGDDAGDAAGDRILALSSGIGGIRAVGGEGGGAGGGSMTAAAARGSYHTGGRVSMSTSRTVKAAPKARAPVRQSGRKRDRHTAAAAAQRQGKAQRNSKQEHPGEGASIGDHASGEDAPSAALAVGRHSHFHSDHGALRCRLESHPLAALQSSALFRQAVLDEVTAIASTEHGAQFDPPVQRLREVRFSLLRTAALGGEGGGKVLPGVAKSVSVADMTPTPTISDCVWHSADALFAVPAGAEQEAAIAEGGAGGLLLGISSEPGAAGRSRGKKGGQFDAERFFCTALLPLLLPVGGGGQQGEGGGDTVSPLRAWCIAVRCAWAGSSSIHASPAAREMLSMLYEHFPAAAHVLSCSSVVALVPKRSHTQLRPAGSLPAELQQHAWLLGHAPPPFTLSDGVAQEVAAAALLGRPLVRSPALAAAGYAAVRVLDATALLAERVQEA